MPRLPRINVEGAIHYVIARGLQGEPIFKEKDDYKMYLELVSKYKSQHNFKLYSYNLLPDRLELLIETVGDASISEIMHDLNSLYTKYFNGRYQKRGHLFEARFKSILVEKVNHLLAMTRHIHLRNTQNPYSSFHIYTQSRPAQEPGLAPSLNLEAEIGEVMEFLKNKNEAGAYQRFVLEGDKSEIAQLEKSLKRGQVLGSESFHEAVKNRVVEHAVEQKEALEGKKPNRILLYFIGGFVIVATMSSVTLYLNNRSLESKYKDLLQSKEAEFSQKTKFENMSPLALADLDGTGWDIEVVPAPRGGVLQKDRVVFKDGRFHSRFLETKGFRTSNYFLLPQGDRVVQWQASQSNPAGEQAIWRGTWQGDVMKGSLELKQSGKESKYLFFSTAWKYEESQ